MKQSLAALRASWGEPGDETDGMHHADGDIAPDLLAALSQPPTVRADEVERVRALLEGGDAPTGDDVATKLIGRLVCDRLR